MEPQEQGPADSPDTPIRREIHHIAIDGEGSATIVEFHCDGECYRLLVTIKGSAVSARWLDADGEEPTGRRIV
jgi:hypothetical protein